MANASKNHPHFNKAEEILNRYQYTVSVNAYGDMEAEPNRKTDTAAVVQVLRANGYQVLRAPDDSLVISGEGASKNV